MYDINAHPYQVAPDQINKTAGVVGDPEVAIAYQKMAMEQQKHDDDERQRMEAQRQAKLEAIFQKIHNTPNQIEQPDIAEKVKDFSNLVTENNPDTHSKDINKRTKASLAITQGLNNLNNIIDSSKNREKTIHDMDTRIEMERKLGNDYHQSDIDAYEKAKGQSYVNGNENDLINSMPSPALDIQKKFNREYAPRLLNTGDVTDTATTGIDGQIHHNFTFNTEAGFEDAKKKMLIDKGIQTELGKQIIEATKQNPDLKKIYYNEDGTPNLKARLDDNLFYLKPVNKIINQNPPQGTGASADKGKDVNLTPLVSPSGQVIGFDAQTKGGADNKEYASVKINGVTKKVIVNDANGMNVNVTIPEDIKRIADWKEKDLKWVNEKDKLIKDLAEQVTKGELTQGDADREKTEWFKANTVPKYPSDAVEKATITGQEAENAFHQAYGQSLKGAYQGKFAPHVRVDKDNVSLQEPTNTPPPQKKKINGF